MVLRDIARGISSLVFSVVCLHCRRAIGHRDDLMCVGCEGELPLSTSYRFTENRLTDRLAGRVQLQFGAFAYVFREGTVCQRLIHALKYHRRPDIGVQLGARFGARIADDPRLADLDAIVPVPIHPRRLRQRGYNQAERIAAGLAEALGVEVEADALRRRDFRGSQTKRGKLDRLENVRESFVAEECDLAGRHVLLVDDVLTTGATIDFCAEALLRRHEQLRISVVTLALAEA